MHWGDILAGALGSATIWAIISHAVQTFPTPANKYGQWCLGTIQYAVGQRERAVNTLAGQDTQATAIQRGHQ